MNYLKLKLDDDTYQYLKDKFDGDINAIEDFVKKTLSKEIEKKRHAYGLDLKTEDQQEN